MIRARQDPLRGVTWLHYSLTYELLIVLLVDELAALTAGRSTGKQSAASPRPRPPPQPGPGSGLVVVGAVQVPRKEVLTVRGLFPTRIALRLSEAEQVNRFSGRVPGIEGRCVTRSPTGCPSVGYVAVHGIAEPVRVRFSHITDDTMEGLGRGRRSWLPCRLERSRPREQPVLVGGLPRITATMARELAVGNGCASGR